MFHVYKTIYVSLNKTQQFICFLLTHMLIQGILGGLEIAGNSPIDWGLVSLFYYGSLAAMFTYFMWKTQ